MCVLASVASVLTLTSLVDMVCGLDLSVSDLEVDESKTLSISQITWHQGHSGIRAAQQSENKHGKTTSQSCARGCQGQTHAAKCALYKAVPECVRNRGPPPPEVTQLQERPTWYDPPSDPLPEVGGTQRSDHTFHTISESDREFGANHTWNPRERVTIRGMEDHHEISGSILVGGEPLETHLLGVNVLA